MELNNTVILRINRALRHTFNYHSLMISTVALFLCGLIFIFFQLGSNNSIKWINIGFEFVPCFLSIAILLIAGILLINHYHSSLKQSPLLYTYKQLLSLLWNATLKGSAIIIPLLVFFIFLWLTVGIFTGLSALPYLGRFLSPLLAFVPLTVFLIIFGSLFIAFALLFLATPLICINKCSLYDALEQSSLSFVKTPITHIILFIIGCIPLIVCIEWLYHALSLTQELGTHLLSSMGTAVYHISILIPTVIILAPCITFFFHMAFESFLNHKETEKKES